MQIDDTNTFDSQSNVIDSYGFSNIDSSTSLSTTATFRGQSVTGNGLSISQATFSLLRSTGTAGSVRAVVYAHSGTYGTSSQPTGSVLAFSNSINISALSTSQTQETFTFTGSNQLLLSDQTNYVIGVEHVSGDTISIGIDVSTPNHDGNASNIFSGSPGSNSTWDIPFQLTSVDSPSLSKTSDTDSGFANVDTPPRS